MLKELKKSEKQIREVMRTEEVTELVKNNLEGAHDSSNRRCGMTKIQGKLDA